MNRRNFLGKFGLGALVAVTDPRSLLAQVKTAQDLFEQGNSAKKPVVLITAFEPFGDNFEKFNMSEEVAKRLELMKNRMPGIDLRVEILPVALTGTEERIKALMELHKPDRVICLGESADANTDVYTRVETTGRTYQVHANGTETLQSEQIAKCDVFKVNSQLNKRLATSLDEFDAVSSITTDAGGWVCDKTYHAVLKHAPNPGAVVFLHLAHPENLQSKSMFAQSSPEMQAIITSYAEGVSSLAKSGKWTTNAAAQTQEKSTTGQTRTGFNR